MAYENLTPETVKKYVLEKTNLFPPNAVLSVYEFGDGEDDGDGFVNFVYRVSDTTGKSVILKQAKEFLRVISLTGGPIHQERNFTEASIMRIKHAITPEYIPEIYHVDRENHLYICEDCSAYKIVRFEMMRGRLYENFPKQIGDFIARTGFYTSEIYMDALEHRDLQEAFVNSKMRQVFEIGLFLNDMSAFPNHEPRVNNKEADPERIAMGEAAWQGEDVQTELLKMRHLHMKKAECLVHGDLHTSNILVSNCGMKIIDQEYTYMGLASCDTGYLTGSLLYEYIRWFYVGDDDEQRAAMRRGALNAIRGLLESYRDTYAACWDKDAKPIYRPHTQYRDELFKQFMREVCGSTGAQVFSRIGNLVPTPDFDDITDRHTANTCCRIALLAARQLILSWESCTDIDDFMNRIVHTTAAARAIADSK